MAKRDPLKKNLLRVVHTGSEMVHVARLKTHPKNVREGDTGAIIESIKQNGFYSALVVQRSTGHILVGNHRFQAALHMGFTELPCFFLDVEDEEALRIMLADNKTSDDAKNNEAALADLLMQLSETDVGLAGTGFDGDDLDDLLKMLDRESVLGPDEGEKAKRETAEKHLRYAVVVVCRDAMEQAEVYSRISDELEITAHRAMLNETIELS